RRRHTRSKRDWSSDVCSSDLIEKLSECQKVCFVPRGSQMQDLTQPQHINTMLYEAELFAELVDERLVDHPGLAVSRITAKLLTRSEERRVGKEGRSEWRTHHE